jgi:hypothetical protein
MSDYEAAARRIMEWNEAVFADAKRKREEKFDELLKEPKKKKIKAPKKYVPLPTGTEGKASGSTGETVAVASS